METTSGVKTRSTGQKFRIIGVPLALLLTINFVAILVLWRRFYIMFSFKNSVYDDILFVYFVIFCIFCIHNRFINLIHNSTDLSKIISNLDLVLLIYSFSFFYFSLSHVKLFHHVSVIVILKSKRIITFKNYMRSFALLSTSTTFLDLLTRLVQLVRQAISKSTICIYFETLLVLFTMLVQLWMVIFEFFYVKKFCKITNRLFNILIFYEPPLSRSGFGPGVLNWKEALDLNSTTGCPDLNVDRKQVDLSLFRGLNVYMFSPKHA
uniref:Uncharacterized protein n=1 Tax=Heterorhabditis bacteriophora TaxID=37862 RepID=A0A1I7WA72_HETBA